MIDSPMPRRPNWLPPVALLTVLAIAGIAMRLGWTVIGEPSADFLIVLDAERQSLFARDALVSAQVGQATALVSVYRALAARCDYALHLGLTEAGMSTKGTVASTAALALLLQEGIGDTIRVSLTPDPGASRTTEVRVAQQILQAMEIRPFLPQVTAFAIRLGHVVSGSVVVEIVFGYPGIGSLLLQAINASDYFVIYGVVFITVLAITLAMLLIDLAYPMLDPRVSYRGA